MLYSAQRLRYSLYNPGFEYRNRQEIFLSSKKHPDCFWDLPNLLISGYRGCFPEVKRPEREADDDSPPSMAEVKNEGSSSQTPPPTPSWLLQGKCIRNSYVSYYNFCGPGSSVGIATD